MGGSRSDAAIDYAADGSVVAIELLGVSRGVDLRGVPERQQVEKLLQVMVCARDRGRSVKGTLVGGRALTLALSQREREQARALAPDARADLPGEREPGES